MVKATRLFTILSALGLALGCQSRRGAVATNADLTPVTPSDEATQEPPLTTRVASDDDVIPAEIHFVIPREASGAWNIDGVLRTTETPWRMVGVEIDDRRIHPPTQVAPLDDGQRQELADLLAALPRMPRCEPIGRFDDDRLFRLSLDEQRYEDPAIWLRSGNAAHIDPSDPCLVPMRIAALLFRVWHHRDR